MANTLNPQELTDLELASEIAVAISWHQTEELGEGKILPLDTDTEALLEERKRRRDGNLALRQTITIVT